MPIKRQWTLPEDAQIRRLRAEGAPWDHIAIALRASRNAAIERGRAIRATAPPPSQRRDPMLAYLTDRARDPLPSGHCVTWAAITAGTLLDAAPYPAPEPIH
jgi:hypothetical protein